MSIRLGDVVRLKGEKREGRVVQTYQSHDGKTYVRVVYPMFDEEGVPFGPGDHVTAPADRFEKPRVAKGDIAYHPESDTEGLVVYARGDYATLRPRGGGRSLNVERDALVRINHYSDEGIEG